MVVYNVMELVLGALLGRDLSRKVLETDIARTVDKDACEEGRRVVAGLLALRSVLASVAFIVKYNRNNYTC